MHSAMSVLNFLKPGFCLILFSTVHWFLFAQETIVFPQRPSFIYTASEIDQLKKDQSKIDEIKSIVKKADAILEQPLKIPGKEGDWIFYYYCPKDNSMLKPQSDICPLCGSVYTDERTAAAYRTHLNYKIDKDCIILAKAYTFTGEKKYAERVKEVLLKLASLYPGFERHDRWGRRGILAIAGGKRYAQHLDEAISAIDLASAYDLIADFLTDEEREICEKFLKDIVREILKYQVFVGKKNNHQTWFNAAYTVVGLTTKDASLMKEGIYGKYGLLWQVENSITDDGLWYEGAMAYHFYALSAIQYTLDAAKRIGWDFSNNERLKSMWLAPLNLAYPDGKLPVFHDSDPVSLASYVSFYQWAYRYFKDPVFASFAEKRDFKLPALKSASLNDIGIAVLRRSPENNPVCAMLDYGIHGDSHGHPDKMNIVFYVHGKELILDPGRISYSVPEYHSWWQGSAASNRKIALFLRFNLFFSMFCSL